MIRTVTASPLAAHLHACERARGRTFALRCAGERMHAVMAPRFCTTVFIAASLIALLAVWT